MTNAEYNSEYAWLRQRLIGVTDLERKKLLAVYESAATEAAATLKAKLSRGASTLTTDRWRQIEFELRNGAKIIADSTDTAVKSAITESYSRMSAIDTEYITSAATIAGVSISGLSSLYSGVNQKLISAVTSSIYNGKSYSSRVWGGSGVEGDWLARVKNLTSAGIAQGRDPVQIAKDLQAYVRGGVQTIGRWGKLKPGTSEYIQRLGSAGVDYRAMRLVRTELYRGMHDASIEDGVINPACDDQYDWVLSPGRINWNCECPSIAAGGPYAKADIPGYPHVLCMCIVRPVMIGRKEFVQQLKDYVSGADTAGARNISNWASKYGVKVE